MKGFYCTFYFMWFIFMAFFEWRRYKIRYFSICCGFHDVYTDFNLWAVCIISWFISKVLLFIIKFYLLSWNGKIVMVEIPCIFRNENENFFFFYHDKSKMGSFDIVYLMILNKSSFVDNFFYAIGPHHPKKISKVSSICSSLTIVDWMLVICHNWRVTVHVCVWFGRHENK